MSESGAGDVASVMELIREHRAVGGTQEVLDALAANPRWREQFGEVRLVPLVWGRPGMLYAGEFVPICVTCSRTAGDRARKQRALLGAINPMPLSPLASRGAFLSLWGLRLVHGHA